MSEAPGSRVVSEAPPSVTEPMRAPALDDGPRPHRARRRVLTGVVVLVVAAVVLVAVDRFGSGRSSPNGTAGRGYATSLQRITERALSQQTQVGGTLGFAGDSTIRMPAGTAPTVVSHAQGSVAADQIALTSARASLALDQSTLADARATLTAGEEQLAVDCAANGAAQSSTSSTQAGGGLCASDAQLVSSDRQAQSQAAVKVATDAGELSSAERTLAAAGAQLAGARAYEVSYGPHSTYTALPSAGRIVHRGQQLYAIDGRPALLLYGSTVVRRAFVAGMSSGPDVGELNGSLDALGYGHALAGNDFTAATASAIRALQRAHGISPTGTLPLGSVVFEPGPVRVTTVAAAAGVGSPVTPGPLLTVSSPARVVKMRLGTSLEGEVRIGDPVIITLPDNSTTPGRITYVSGVASAGQNGPTVEVNATPTHPRATGRLDQAPVQVEITTARVRHALVVPVSALLARSGGGYAVEELSRGRHRLVTVHTGLFDDADGLVQVSGAGLAAGQRVVVPGS